MSGQIRQLIDAIAAGDTLTAMNTFNEVAAEKVAAKLEDKKVRVASGLFGESVEEESEEDELNLEDYSPEEIQEFLDSEEGQQLDELSKSTLKSYIKNAKDSKSAYQDEKDSAREYGDRKTFHNAARKVDNHKDGIRRAKARLSVKEELNLEDYTPEEIQEFLDSEDGQQLDEISKQALGNYLTKAIDKKSQLAVNNTKKATNASVEKYYKRSNGIKTAIKKLTKD